MQEVTPSEILDELRNDGRGRHHRLELENEIARLENILVEIRKDLGLLKLWVVIKPEDDQLGGS